MTYATKIDSSIANMGIGKQRARGGDSIRRLQRDPEDSIRKELGKVRTDSRLSPRARAACS